MNSLKTLMNRRALGLTGGLVLAAGGLAWSANAFADQTAHPKVSVKIDDQAIARSAHPEAASFAPVVKRVAPSVVKVLVTERAKNGGTAELPEIFQDPAFRQFFGDGFGGQGGQNGGGNGRGRGGRGGQMQRQPLQAGLGSGVIVSSDGYILTNNHVVHDADSIRVTLADGRELTAKVVGADPQSDLAVVKIEAKDLPAITFADSEKIEVGDRVLAIGNPFGIGQTVTSGMVSALGRATLGLDYEDFIQTDAAINPGNSGGALVDVEGRLIGINTAILSRSGGFQGIGFAVPSSLARNVMEQLVQNGKVVRGYLGVSIQDMSPELASAFKLPERSGALVADVVPSSPGGKAGLKSGDVITGLGDKPVADARHLKLAVGNLAPGTEVAVKVLRDGKTQTINLKVGDQPKSRDVASNDDGSPSSSANNGSSTDDEGTLNGVGVADLDPQMRREFDVPAKIRGAIVTEVDPSSAAASAGLQPGDVIQEINRKPVRSAEDAVKMTEKTESKKTLLRVWSQRGARFVIVDETPVPETGSTKSPS